MIKIEKTAERKMDVRRSNRQIRTVRRRALAAAGVVVLALLACVGAAMLLTRTVRYDAVSADGAELGSYSSAAGDALSVRIDGLYAELNSRFGTELSPRVTLHRRSSFFGFGETETAELSDGGAAFDVDSVARGLVLDSDKRLAYGLLIYIGGEPVACVSDNGSAARATERAENAAAYAIAAELGVSVEGKTTYEAEPLLCPADELLSEDGLYTLLSAGLTDGSTDGSTVDGTTDSAGDAASTVDAHPLLLWARTAVGAADEALKAAEDYFQPLVQLRRYRTLFAEETGGYAASELAGISLSDVLSSTVSTESGTAATSESDAVTAAESDTVAAPESSSDGSDAVEPSADTAAVSADGMSTSSSDKPLTEQPYYRSANARALLSVTVTRSETAYRSTDYGTVEELRSDRPSGYTYPRREGIRGIAAVTETVSYGTDGSIIRESTGSEELVKPIPEIVLVGEGSTAEPGKATGELLWPLETTDMYIGSLFREVREAFDARTGHHIGADLQIDKGEPVWAADGGTVILAEEHLTYGLLVEIDHGNGLVSFYGHLSDITVSEGDTVAPLDIVGHIGDTGVATSPHLHFELRRDDVPINPFEYLPDIQVNYEGEKVSSRDLDAGE